ncbi:MAG: ABC transporter substrate binding protein [Desulfobacterales bacterium]
MNLKANFCGFMAVAFFLICGLHPAEAQENKKFKVLAVMSYDEVMPWVTDTKEGIDNVLSKSCEIRYVYMNTRNDFEGGKEKARQAYELYQEFQPDGVIAADDDAQAMFVVPYLRDKVKTPVIFCGVNKEPETYGYPAANVSGILERFHFAESIAFLQQLVPSVKTVSYIMGDNPTAKGSYAQIEKEKESYSAKSVAFRFVKTLDEGIAAANETKTQCDAVFIENIIGIKDKNGNPLTGQEAVPVLAKACGIPTMAANVFIVKYGLLCAVVKTGQEQGETSAKMLLKAMQGTPVSEIPITRNHQGKRMINVTVLKELGISIRPEIIGSAELVKTEN